MMRNTASIFFIVGVGLYFYSFQLAKAHPFGPSRTRNLSPPPQPRSSLPDLDELLARRTTAERRAVGPAAPAFTGKPFGRK